MKGRRSQSGQGMTEYILIVALIAIACIVAVKHFSKATSEGFEEAGKTISGQSRQANTDAKQEN